MSAPHIRVESRKTLIHPYRSPRAVRQAEHRAKRRAVKRILRRLAVVMAFPVMLMAWYWLMVMAWACWGGQG